MYMPTNVAIIWAYGKAGIRNPEQPEPETEPEPEPELKLRPV